MAASTSTFQVNSTNPYGYLESLKKIGNKKSNLWNGFELDLDAPKSKGSCQVFIKNDFHFYRSNYQIRTNILLKGKQEKEDEEYFDFRMDNSGRALFMIKDNKEWQPNPVLKNEKSYHIFLKKKIIGVDDNTLEEKNKLVAQSQQLKKLSSDILSIFPSGNQNALLTESKILEFIYAYLEYLQTPVDLPPSFLSSDYSIQCIHNAKKLLEENYVNPLTIDKLSKKVGTNRNQLKIGFKYLFGTTIRQFVINLRLEQGRQMILNTALPLGQICNLVGYVNHGHFSKLYKQRFGVSPIKDRGISRRGE